MHQKSATPQFKLRKKRNFSTIVFVQLGVLGLLLLAGAAYYYYTFDTIASAEVTKVQRGTALAGVYGTVYVAPVNEVVVRTRNFGQITKLNIKEGDTVKTGQLLAVVADDSFQRQLDSSVSALEEAKARQAVGPASAADLRNQEIQVDKLKSLLAANNIAPIEYQKANNELLRLREQVQNETAKLKLEVENLTRACDAVKSQLGQLQITSPLDGVILNLYCNLGEFVPPQEQLCRIGSSNNEIVAQVNEEDVGNLQPGMKAKIRLYAYQDKDLIGTLREILPQAENQLYRVIFDLEDPPRTILPGMTGEMNIIIAEHKDVLTIPSRALCTGNQVLVVQGNIVRQVHVKTGFRTLEKTEISEGLKEGDIVILSSQDLYKEGIRVRDLIFKDGLH